MRSVYLFAPPARQVFEACGEEGEKGRQMLLFSATMPPWVDKVVKAYMKEDRVFIDLVKEGSVKASKDVEHIGIPCHWQRCAPRSCCACCARCAVPSYASFVSAVVAVRCLFVLVVEKRVPRRWVILVPLERGVCRAVVPPPSFLPPGREGLAALVLVYISEF